MSSDEDALMHSDSDERRRRGKGRAAAESSSSSDSSSDSSDSSSGEEAEEAETRAPITDAREISVDLRALNPSLTCGICRGYYREATTIMDCLHIFCKSCLERHIVSTRRNDVVRCPIKTCHSQMISTNPLRTECRFDRAMQNLVDKLLPKFAKEDEELKQQIAREHGKDEESQKKRPAGATNEAAEPASKRQKFGDEKFLHEKMMIFELRPWSPPAHPPGGDAASAASATPTPLSPLPHPFVKTSAKVTVKFLRKFIAERLGLPPQTSLDIQCSGEVLGTDHSIEFIWRTRWHHLHPNQHLVLTYRIQSHVI